MKCHLILNPRSNSGKAGTKFETIFRLLTRAGIEYECSYAQTYDSIRAAAADAHAGDHDAIVAVGGDGTINAVINSFFDEDGTLKSDKMMGVIYTGTSPDFCRSYGIPLDLKEAVEVIRKQEVRKIRVGKIELRRNPDSFETETRYFSCCASIGIGAMVADKANRLRKYLGDGPGTFAAILSSLMKFTPGSISIITEDGARIIPRVTNIFIGRTRYIASGLKFRDGIPDGDARFYVICVKNLNLRRFPGLLRQLYSGNITESEVLNLSFAEKIELNAEKSGIAVEFDGDPAGFLPCSIQVALYPIQLITGDQS
jgi:diacylglycerol kinase family enzyme